jgi:hypothetical protein
VVTVVAAMGVMTEITVMGFSSFSTRSKCGLVG